MTNNAYARTAAGMFDTLSRRITSVERRLPPGVTPIPPEPAGVVKMFAAATAPTGYLLCDGASYLRADYPTLFTLIGTTYGSVDGTHFNVPNLKGRVVVGLDATQTEFDALAETGGAKTHILTTSEIPSHTHGQTYAGNAIAAGGGAAVGGMTSAGGTSPTAAEQITQAIGGGGAHNNLQPYMVMNYIIKT